MMVLLQRAGSIPGCSDALFDSKWPCMALLCSSTISAHGLILSLGSVLLLLGESQEDESASMALFGLSPALTKNHLEVYCSLAALSWLLEGKSVWSNIWCACFSLYQIKQWGLVCLPDRHFHKCSPFSVDRNVSVQRHVVIKTAVQIRSNDTMHADGVAANVCCTNDMSHR